MSINKEHLYRGAAIALIAEDRQNFKAINPLVINGRTSRAALMVNHNIPIYLKYAVKPHGRLKEFVFNFRPEHIDEIHEIWAAHPNTYLVLTCADAKEVGCITAEEFFERHQAWLDEVVDDGKQFQLIIAAPKRKELRVYVNQPGRRNRTLTAPLLRPRSAFPAMIFN